MTAPRFSPKALAFLRALKRNNDREWFKARKEQYERAPARADDRAHRAAGRRLPGLRAGSGRRPEDVALPHLSRHALLGRTRRRSRPTSRRSFPGAVSPSIRAPVCISRWRRTWVWVGGGMYAPDTSQLHAVREHIAANHKRLRAIVESPGFRRTVGALEGEQLQRVPRGFPKDHPRGANYLQASPVSRRPGVSGRRSPASPRFYAGVLGVFRQVAPLIAFLNERADDRAASDPTPVPTRRARQIVQSSNSTSR